MFYQTVDSWPSDTEVEDEVFGEKHDDIKDKEFTDIILTEIVETMERGESGFQGKQANSKVSRNRVRCLKFEYAALQKGKLHKNDSPSKMDTTEPEKAI